MSLSANTVLDRIEIEVRTGTVYAIFSKQIVDGDMIIDSKPHRASLEVGSDLQGRLAEISNHIASIGFPAVAAKDVAQITTFADIAMEGKEPIKHDLVGVGKP